MTSILLSYFFIFSIVFWPFGPGSEDKAALKKTSVELPQAAEEVRYMRVMLDNGLQETFVESPWPFEVYAADGRLLFTGKNISRTQIAPAEGGIRFGRQKFSGESLTIQSQGDGIKIGSRFYRNGLIVWLNADSTLTLVNLVELEDYLKGVLPWEVNPKWTMEVLKAQAVASLTYALFKAIENKDSRFDVSKGVMSQVYGGKNSENSVTSKAVDATRGQILTFKGELFPAYFHSTCGGATTDAEYQWDIEPHPALKGVQCEFCRGSKHYRWEVAIPKKEILAKLKKNRIALPSLDQIDADESDRFGRIRKFKIAGGGVGHKIRANDFRLWVDPAKLKSTLIQEIREEGGSFVFRGKGWGHGSGMCQYGAKGLSDLGYSYRDILEYYYPGSKITQFYS